MPACLVLNAKSVEYFHLVISFLVFIFKNIIMNLIINLLLPSKPQKTIRNVVCCVITMFLSLSCIDNDLNPRPYVIAEFSNQIQGYVMFQEENRAYVSITHGPMFNEITDVYRVDLLNGIKTLIFSTEGYARKFVVSSDEKFLSISVVTQSSTSGSTTRLELFDMITEDKTVLKISDLFIVPCAFDNQNTTLLYSIYENNENKIRKINLASENDTIIPGNPSGVVLAIDPITMNILIQSSGEAYFINWEGDIIGEKIKGFTPWLLSPDGKKITGYIDKFVDVNGESIYFRDIIFYTIATKSVDVLISSENPFFSLTSLSTDQNLALCGVGDLYVLNTTTLKKYQLMSTRREEIGVGFFDENKQVLFISGDDAHILYGIKLAELD
jgi:hypothetical protein